MKVSKLITGKAVVTISSEKSVSDLINLLCEHKFGAVVVSENGSDIQGIVSERDIIKNLNAGTDLKKITVSEIMTKDVFVCKGDELVSNLLQSMTNGRFRHCPVVDESGKLLSIVSIGDLVKTHISEIVEERDALNSYIHSYDMSH